MNFISIPTEDYIPGIIINDDDRIIDALFSIFDDEPPAKWKTKVVNANIASQTIQGERNLDLGLTVLGIFTLKAGVTAKYSASFEFGNATAIVFDTATGGVFENQVRTMIMKLKKEDQVRWKQILHQTVVLQAIYVESLSAEFKRNGQIVTEAEAEKLKNEVTINGKFSWDAAGKMVIKNNKVPFGVMGFMVKRGM